MCVHFSCPVFELACVCLSEAQVQLRSTVHCNVVPWRGGMEFIFVNDANEAMNQHFLQCIALILHRPPVFLSL